MDPDRDDLAAAKTALAVLGVALFLGAQLVSWLFLAFASSSDSAPERTCPCPWHATVWTFLFWLPDLVLAVATGAAIAARRRGGVIFTAGLLCATAGLVALDYVYLADVRRVWSLPPLPR